MVTPNESVVGVGAPARIAFDEANELDAKFSRIFLGCGGRAHPDLALGIGYRGHAAAETAAAASVGETFYSAMVASRDEWSALPRCQRPPRRGSDVLHLFIEPEMVVHPPQGAPVTKRLRVNALFVGVWHPHPMGLCFERDGTSLVVAFEMSARDLRALHLRLDERNAAFGF